MAKTKTKSHSKSSSRDILHSTDGRIKSSTKRQQRPIEDLLTEAASLLEQGQPESALPLAEEALQRLEAERASITSVSTSNDDLIDAYLRAAAEGKATLPTTLTLSADIHLALGDIETAQKTFTTATQVDPDGALVSAEPWLWLAQLCEEGGKESIRYFEKAVEVLRNEIEVLSESIMDGDEEGLQLLDEKKSKLADALCGMTEVYMTDLSWENDAEMRCENYVTEAVAICPERLGAGVLQTLASVRISQERIEEARSALRRSMEVWRDLPESVENDARPDFATRVSLSRLLMEVEVEPEALNVIEGLVREDDQSVEAWYLGGWCCLLISQKQGVSPETKSKMQQQARLWLDTCLRLYKVQDYEDNRLRDHAMELKQSLNKALGIDDDEDAWEDEEDEGDEEDGDPEENELELHEDVEANGHAAHDSDVEMS